MNDFINQLQERYIRQQQIGKGLSQCVSIAQSVGQLADCGKQYHVKPEAESKFIGAVQVGEYILTGEIPPASLIREVIKVGEVAQ